MIDRKCPVPTCQYSVKPDSRQVKPNLLKHIKRMRESEKYQPNAPHPHIDLDDAILGFKSRISRGELQHFNAEERQKRKKDLRNESQRRRREQSREEAKEKAAAHGDATHWKLYDKTTSYARMATSKRRLEENYQFLPTDALLASDDMGGLFCFYLHFFLGVTIPEDLDQQLHGVAFLVEGLRVSYPSADGETFRTVSDFYSVCNYR
jgi:hypothetical protein